MTQSKENDSTWLLIIVLVFILILYFLSLGRVNLIDKPEEDRNQWIEHRIKKLQKLISSKKLLKEKLDQCVRKSFFITRLLISILYVLLNLMGYFLIKPADFDIKLSLILNYNQIFLIILLLICFMKFEKPSNIDTLVRIIHLKIKKIVYGKFIGLEDDVKHLEIQLAKLSSEKDLLNDKNSSESTTKL